MSNPFDLLANVFTGGAHGAGQYITGDSDFWDPGHFFTKSDADKLAEDQWDWQKQKYEQNYKNQEKWNYYNAKWNEKAFYYQHWLNQLGMQREDTAVQRRVDDLKAAGLSPTLAAGSAADAGAMHAGSVPQASPPQFEVGENPMLQASMFKQQMLHDSLALASTIMGNVADISRTKAETELISAQKDKLVAETPLDLRLKELAQELREELNPREVRSVDLDLDLKELKKVNEDLTNEIKRSEVKTAAYEAIIKHWESVYAERSNKSQVEKLEQEIKEKEIAVEMARILLKNTQDTGVHPDLMTNYAKTVLALSHLGNKPDDEPGDKGLNNMTLLGKIAGKIRSVLPKSWRSPSISGLQSAHHSWHKSSGSHYDYHRDYDRY